MSTPYDPEMDDLQEGLGVPLEKAKARVVIVVEGGVVQEVFVSHPIAVEIIDHDNLAEKGHSRVDRARIEREACAGLSDVSAKEVGGA